jgi:hypothetical protein
MQAIAASTVKVSPPSLALRSALSPVLVALSTGT